MNKIISVVLSMFFLITLSKAQTIALDFSKNDCGGTYHHLYADLDSGHAVILHFFMPACASCPPPAQEIMAMAENINLNYPDKVKAYAFPFNNTTSCATSSSWVLSNGLNHLFVPMDSGATMVAHYGGFGMPTVVLLGGLNHRVLFSTKTYTTSDTTIMRDSILAMINGPSGMDDAISNVNSFSLYPNPARETVSIQLDLNEPSTVIMDVVDISGKQVATIMDEKRNGTIIKQISTTALPNGNYMVQLHVNGKTISKKLTIIH